MSSLIWRATLALLLSSSFWSGATATVAGRVTENANHELDEQEPRNLLWLGLGGGQGQFTGAVTGFELINSLTNRPLFNLTNNQVIALSDISGMTTTPSFNIRAWTTGSGIRSVVFGHNNRTNVRREVQAPWAFCGNVGTTRYPACPLLSSPLGTTHTITATPYSSKRGRSGKGQSLSVTFTIVQSKAPTAATPVAPSAPKAPTVASPIGTSPMSQPAASIPTNIGSPNNSPVLASPVAPPVASPVSSPIVAAPVVAGPSNNAPIAAPMTVTAPQGPTTPIVAPTVVAAPASPPKVPDPAPKGPTKAPTKAPASAPKAPTKAPTSAPVGPPFDPIRINSGGDKDYVDGLGRTWIKDAYFTGGTTYCDGGNPPIGATDLDVIYHCERYGALTYAIPVPAAAGTYDVVLHFAEIFENAAGLRLFNVAVEGATVLSNLDLYATVGKNTAYTKSTTVAVVDGFVTIVLTNVPGKGNAKISGIEVTRSGSTVKPPAAWINSDVPIISRYQGCFTMVNNPIVGRRAYLVGGIGANLDTEVYNPLDRTWSKAKMPPIGLSHMNCVAAQGKLWIPAAWDGEKNIEFIYVYDPATNTWGTKTAMPMNRRRGSAAVMVSPDETKIYVSHGTTGGHEWEQNQNKAMSLPYLDVYDIATDTWTELSSSAPNVRDHVGGAIVNGKLVCVAGGRHGGEYGFPAVEPTDCFNLDTKVWEPKPPLFPARSRAQYATTCDGKLMVAGGEYRGTTFNDVNIFDGTNWTRYANLPNNGRHSGGLAVDCTCNQMHLVSGLVTSYGDAVDKTMSTYYPDGVKTDCSSGPKLPDPGNSAPSPPLPVGCELPRLAGTGWQDGRPYPLNVAEAQGMMIGNIFVVYGGFWKDWPIASNRTYTLDTSSATATWERVDDIPIGEGLTHGAHVHLGSKIYNCGGYVGGHPGLHTNKCIVYDQSQPLGQRWSQIAPLPDGRGGGSMFHNAQLNTIYYVSGAQRYKKPWLDTLDFNTTWGYAIDNPGDGWVRKADLPYASNHMMAVTTKDGSGKERHYAFGGQYKEDEPEGNYKQHYEYNALEDKWIKRNFMPYARAHATSSTHGLGCGFIMVAGNTNGNLIISNVTYYSTETDSWYNLGNFPHELNTPICDINRNTNVMYCETGRLWTSRSYTRQLLL